MPLSIRFFGSDSASVSLFRGFAAMAQALLGAGVGGLEAAVAEGGGVQGKVVGQQVAGGQQGDPAGAKAQAPAGARGFFPKSLCRLLPLKLRC